MELTQLIETVLQIFQIERVEELKSKLMDCVLNNKVEIYEKFLKIDKFLENDYMQKIFQYYEADRKIKKQDFTPKSIAKLISNLSNSSDEIIDLCAGSGALTIQKWNKDRNTKFKLYEIDENVIPFLLFNICIRNIEAEIYHCDILNLSFYKIYRIEKDNKFSEVKTIENIDIKSTV